MCAIASSNTVRTLSADIESNPDLDFSAALTAALGTPNSLPLRPQDEALLEDMAPFHFGPNNSRQAWSLGEGPLVLLVHGYSGRGVQMATLAHHIAQAGFRCVVFDAGGHGASAPEKIGFFTFMNDTRDLVAHLDAPIFAMIGHSAGALGMMRALSLYNVQASRYCVISAPLFPYVPLESMRATGASQEALDYVKAVLSDQFQMSWSSLTSGESFKGDGSAPLLAVYDTTDKKVRHTDADQIAALWPHSDIVKTSGYGHNKILQAEETLEAVTQFLTDRKE